jgi:hypothetical protein
MTISMQGENKWEGICKANIGARVAKIVSFPRSKWTEVKATNPELSGFGFYFLVSKPQAGVYKVYIGETNSIKRRIAEHIRAGAWRWELAITCLSTDGSLTKTHVQHLENMAYQRAAGQRRFLLQNPRNLADIAPLPEAERITVGNYFEDFCRLISFYFDF